VIEDVYREEMKEFYIGCDFEYCGVFPVASKRKIKVDLCEDCYQGLHLIAKAKRSEQQ
jgi:hypothetical protein